MDFRFFICFFFAKEVLDIEEFKPIIRMTLLLLEQKYLQITSPWLSLSTLLLEQRYLQDNLTIDFR